MTTVTEREREEIEHLLPWYAAGTLSRRDAHRVKAALANDPELARRYDMVREEHGHTVHLNETSGAPSAHIMERLFAKIDAEVEQVAPPFNLGARVHEFVAAMHPRTIAWYALAGAVAIVLQASLITGIAFKSPAAFETASMSAPVKALGSFALIRFQPQASAEEITRFLSDNKLRLVDGPSAGGIYRVKIAAVPLSRSKMAERIKTLQNEHVVSFVGAAE